MGILTNKELTEIEQLLENSNYGTIPFSPIMQKDFDTVLLDRMNKTVYFITRMDFKRCYKKQTKDEFMKTVENLQKDGWQII